MLPKKGMGKKKNTTQTQRKTKKKGKERGTTKQ